MSFPVCWGILIVLTWLCGSLPAAEPRNVDAPLLEHLLSEFQSGSPDARSRVESQLIGQGEAILPWLGQRTPQQPADVQATLLRVARTIEDAAAMQAIEQTGVRFPSFRQAVSIEEFLQTLSEQTGVTLKFVPDDFDPSATIDSPPEIASFWEAIDRLADVTRRDWTWGADRSLVFVPRTAERSPLRDVHSAFQVAAVAERHPSALLLRIQLRVDAAPQIQPFVLFIHDQDLELSVDGTALPCWTPDARREIPFQSQTASVTVSFRLPEGEIPSPTPAALLKGSVRIFCAARRETASFSLSEATPTSRWTGRTEVTLAGVSESAEARIVTLHVRYPDDLVWDSHRLGLLHADCWMRGPDERVIHPEAMELVATDGQLQTVRYRFPPSERPSEDVLQYESPVLIGTRDVTFSIPDVPLP